MIPLEISQLWGLGEPRDPGRTEPYKAPKASPELPFLLTRPLGTFTAAEGLRPPLFPLVFQGAPCAPSGRAPSYSPAPRPSALEPKGACKNWKCPKKASLSLLGFHLFPSGEGIILFSFPILEPRSGTGNRWAPRRCASVTSGNPFWESSRVCALAWARVCVCVCVWGPENKCASVKMDNEILLPLFQAWSSWWEREAEGVGGALAPQKTRPKRRAGIMWGER